MAWQPPSEWDEYIGGFGSPFAPPVDQTIPVIGQQFALPGELAKSDVGSLPPPPPPPPPPPHQIGAFGAPAQDEVPLYALDAQPSSPEQLEQPQVLEAPPSDVQSPPLLGQVDAISGGVTPEQKARDAGAVDAQGGDTRELLPDDPMQGDELGAMLSTLSPEEQEKFRAKVEGGRQKLQAAGTLEAGTKALRDAEDNARIYQESVKAAQKRSAELDVDAKQLADENPLDSISGTRKVFGVLAAIVGGFMVNKTGRNMGLEIVEQMANDAAQQHAQKLQLNARQQAATGDQVSRAGDAYKASETVRLAFYDGAIKHLETEVQNYDPRGTTALRVMDDLNQIKAKRAELLGKYRDQELKRTENLLKEQRELLKDAEAQRHNIAGERNDSTRAYADLLRAKTEKKKADAEDGAPYSPEQLAQLHPGNPVPPLPMNEKQYGKWLDTQKAGRDVAKSSLELSPDERARQNAVGEIIDDKGDPVLFRSPEFAGKIAKSKGAADNAVRLIDKLILARRKYGWSSNLMKSSEWREMQADYKSLQLEKKNTDELGVLAGPDMGMIEGSLGTSDPTEARDPTPGLRAARSNIVEQVNSKIRGEAVLPKGRKLTRWEPPALDELPETAPLIQGKTGVEQGEGNKIGALSHVSFYSDEERARRGEEGANVGPTGLDTTDDKRVTEAIAAAQGESATSAESAVQRLADAASSEREAVNNAVLTRIRVESPDVYERVVAKLPTKQRNALQQAAPVADVNLGPKLTFDTLTVEELAAKVHGDANIRQLVIDKALNGTPEEKKKASETIARASGAGQ
jgi:hypothetical protein